MSRASVVVVGAGVSGLAAAWELSGGAKGPDDTTPRVEVIEMRDRVGGALATTTFAGRTIDLGADGFLARRTEATTLVNELAMSDELEAIATSGASLWSRGALHELPHGLVLGVPTTLASIRDFKGLSWKARLAARRDVRFPTRLHVGDDATIGEIVRRKLGDELSYQFIEPMIGGIQAGRIDELSAKSVFPALLEAARAGGSLMRALGSKGPALPGPTSAPGASGPMFFTLTSGVGSLPQELERQLIKRGVILRRGVEVSALRRTPAGDYPWEVDTFNTTTPANAIILATLVSGVASLLGMLDPAIDALRHIDYAGAAMVTFAIRRDEVVLPEQGTGVLVPLNTPWSNDESMMVTAITLLDRKWPHLARESDVLLRAHVGRIDDTRWSELDDEELTSRVTDELARLLPHFGSPYATLVQRWPSSLPQYRLGHDLLVANARAASAALRVELAGSAYDGVGVPASIGSGRRAARSLLKAMNPSP